jgi:hypothetical protein
MVELLLKEQGQFSEILSLQFKYPSGVATKPLEELLELDELDVVELEELDDALPGPILPPQAIRERRNTRAKKPAEYFIFTASCF